ncbi:hypothetical protein MESS2_790090 [Mesorhizobium metallidurans STM 2683]|uniref:Uncharacterized protein n=1 Tax=Mesorhizobium metallidurans STM 2683 TaxID=1297569 RepID=M5EXR0_9HYPH|nr:hypothetical protein MESS2_790090 [Mesorhizobium metallidurans STM 2683]
MQSRFWAAAGNNRTHRAYWTMRGRVLADDRAKTRLYRCDASGRPMGGPRLDLATITFPCDKFCVRAFATRRAERFGRPFPDTVNL